MIFDAYDIESIDLLQEKTLYLVCNKKIFSEEKYVNNVSYSIPETQNKSHCENDITKSISGDSSGIYLTYNFSGFSLSFRVYLSLGTTAQAVGLERSPHMR